MAALTPSDAKSSIVNVIEIFDSDDEPNITQNLPPDMQVGGNISLSTCSAAEKGEKFDTNYAQNNNENLGFGEDVLFGATPKRKIICNVVLSDDDDEGDDMHTQEVCVDKLVSDDDVPISQLTRRKEVTQHCLQSPSRSQDDKKSSCTPYKDDDKPISQLTRIKKVTRRRLQPLRNCENQSQVDKKSPCRPYKVNKLQQTIPTTNVDDDESEEELSYGEGGNMGGFIVDDSDVSNSEDTSKNSQDGSNGEEDSDSSNSQVKEDNSKVSYSQDESGEKGKNSDINCSQNNEEKLDIGEDVIVFETRKRKWTRNVVLSDSENDDDDDDVPISKLMHIQEVSDDDMPISRLITMKRVSKQHKVKNEQTIPTNVDATDDDEIEEGLSYSEEGNLSSFIDDSDVYNCKNASSKSQDESNGLADADSSNLQDLEDGDKDSDSQDVSDGGIDYGMVISQFRRKRNRKMKWDFEADMLADFGKDSELCMKAVCALNREQTYKEEMWKKEGFCPYKCGFSKYDAGRGSTLAEFLTDGDPQGALKKTVKELEEYDPEAVEVCRTFATRYSRQLYEIYLNKRDCFFP